MTDLILAFDFGGTKHTAGLIGRGETEFRARQQVTSPPDADGDYDIRTMLRMGHELLGDARPAAVGVSFGGLERIEDKANALSARVKFLQVHGQAVDLAHGGQRAPGDVLQGQLEARIGTGPPLLGNGVDEPGVVIWRHEFRAPWPVPDDDAATQFNRAVNGALEEGPPFASAARIRGEEWMQVLPEMNAMDAAACKPAAAGQFPQEAGAILAWRLEHDLQVEEAKAGGDIRYVLGRGRVKGAGGKAEAEAGWFQHA